MKNAQHIFCEGTIALLSYLIYRHNTKGGIWSFLWPPPRETHGPCCEWDIVLGSNKAVFTLFNITGGVT